MNTPPAIAPNTPILDATRAALQSTIETLEAERKRAAMQVWQNTAVAGFGVAVLWLFAVKCFGASSAFPMMFYAIILFVILAAAVRNNVGKTYRDGFKSLILPPLMNTFGECDYSPRGFISESDFKLCQLFRAPEIYNGEDLVSIRVGATALRCSQIHAEYETDSSKKNKQRHTIFKGIFIIADFNKNFPGMTLVYPDTAEKMLGRFGQTLQNLNGKIAHGGREVVKLEDPDFEHEFVVYSHDQVEARYVLSSALMRRLLELRKRAGTSFYMSFFAGNLYLAIPSYIDYFEPPPLSQPLTQESLQPCIDQMSFIFGLVNDLDLNTRIWSKSAPPMPFKPPTSSTSANAFWVGQPPPSSTGVS